jgi:nucleoside-diphosphate-sugar epimerase
MNYTVLGAGGFIGGALKSALLARGIEPFCPGRSDIIDTRNLGTVFYCIGLTADFRQRPFDTIEAHVTLLNHLLRTADFKRLIYLSSTRVYAGLEGLVDESATLHVNPNNSSDLYNLSKLMGESACLQSGREAVVARISNVVGPDFSSPNFIFDLIRDALSKGIICLRSSPESSKDYIRLEDAVEALIAIALLPSPKPIYNIASGRNITNSQICETIAAATKCAVSYPDDSPLLDFPLICTAKARNDLRLLPKPLLNTIEDLANQSRTTKKGDKL